MLTIFTSPKAFRNQFDRIQCNTLSSWTNLGHGTQVVVVGNEPGTTEAVRRFGAHHIPQVDTDPQGLPYIDSLVRHAEHVSPHRMVMYANADILFLPELIGTIEAVQQWTFPFLIVGSRTDLDVHDFINFANPKEISALRQRALKDGKHPPPGAIDYFLFSKGLFGGMPPLVIGRPAWDNWMLWGAIHRGARLINATNAILAIHQNHDYSHHPGGKSVIWNDPSAQSNRAIMGEWRAYTLDDATHRLDAGGLHRNWRPARFTSPCWRAYYAFVGWTKPVRRHLGLMRCKST
jgi:hypothetical protein